ICRQLSSLSGAYLIVAEKISILSFLNVVSGALYFVLVPILTFFFGINGLFVGVSLTYFADALLKFKKTGVSLGKISGAVKLFSLVGKSERALITTGAVYAIASWLSYALQNYDNLLLGLFWPKDHVAQYAIAYLPVFLMLVASSSIFSATAVHFTRTKGAERLRIVKTAVKYSLVAATLLGIVAVAGYFVLTKFFLQKYWQSFLILPYLVLPFIVESAVNSLLVSFLVTAGERGNVLSLRAAQLAVAFIAGFFLIRSYGIMGAVAAYWISAIFGTILIFAFSVKFFSEK
ncbi:MAG: MATE family efflux transporter, partial [archaeon]